MDRTSKDQSTEWIDTWGFNEEAIARSNLRAVDVQRCLDVLEQLERDVLELRFGV